MPANQTNSLVHRLPQHYATAGTFKGDPQRLIDRAEALLSAQTFLLDTLPKHLAKTDDTPALYQTILRPIELITQPLLTLSDDPFLQQIERETIALLNHITVPNPNIKNQDTLLTTLELIKLRSICREQSEQPHWKDLIEHCDQLVTLMIQPNLRDSNNIRALLQKMIAIILPHWDEPISHPLVKHVQQLINDPRLAEQSSQTKRIVENREPLISSANNFIDNIKHFRDLQHELPEGHITQLIKEFEILQDLPDNTADWIKVACEKKLNIAKALMVSPTDIIELPRWALRIHQLREQLSTRPWDELEFAPQAIQAQKGINSLYLYQDNDIQALLQQMIDTYGEDLTGVTLAPSAVATAQTLQDYINLWLQPLATHTQPNVFVIPYSPANADGTNSLHWTAILLELNSTRSITVHFIDPLHSDSRIPTSLLKQLNNILSHTDLKRIDRTEGINFQQPLTFHPIKHDQQTDVTSCGVRVVAEIKQLLDHWHQNKALPNQLDALPGIIELRQEHLTLLGGLNSDFGRRQLWNIFATDETEFDILTLEKQDQLRFWLTERLIELQKTSPVNYEQLQLETPSCVQTFHQYLSRDHIHHLMEAQQDLALEPLYHQALTIADNQTRLQSAFDLAYEHAPQLIFAWMELNNQLQKQTADNRLSVLSQGLRTIMTQFFTDQAAVAKTQPELQEAIKARAITIAQGFFSGITTFNEAEDFTDLSCNFEAIESILPQLTLSKTIFSQRFLQQYQIQNQNADVHSYIMIHELKNLFSDFSPTDTAATMDSLKALLTTGSNEKMEKNNQEVALQQWLHPTHYNAQLSLDSQPLKSQLPMAYLATIQTILQQINLQEATCLRELTHILQQLKRLTPNVYAELWDSYDTEQSIHTYAIHLKEKALTITEQNEMGVTVVSPKVDQLIQQFFLKVFLNYTSDPSATE